MTQREVTQQLLADIIIWNDAKGTAYQVRSLEWDMIAELHRLGYVTVSLNRHQPDGSREFATVTQAGRIVSQWWQDCSPNSTYVPEVPSAS